MIAVILVFFSRILQVSQKDWQYHAAKITALSWAPNSSRLATGSIDTNVIVWSVAEPDSVLQGCASCARLSCTHFFLLFVCCSV